MEKYRLNNGKTQKLVFCAYAQKKDGTMIFPKNGKKCLAIWVDVD